MQQEITIIPAEAIAINITNFQTSAFNNEKPIVFNEALIPAEVRSKMSFGWDRTYFPSRIVHIFELDNVVIGAQGLVMDSNFRIIKESINQHTKREIEDFITTVKTASSIPYNKGKFLNLRKRGEHNYGHWLIECLPKLHYLEKLKGHYDLLLPFIGNRMDQVISDSIALSEFANSNSLRMPKNEIRRFERITIIDGLTKHGAFMAPEAVYFNEKIVKHIYGTNNEKLFFIRNSKNRQLEHANKLLNELKSRDFKFITPGELTLKEQIAAVKNAKIIISTMGAELTNMVFTNRGANVINLAPASMPDTFYHFIAKHKHHHYKEFRLQSNSRASPMNISCATVQEILALLE